MRQNIENELVILRHRQVDQHTCLARSTLYQYIKGGRFAKPVPLDPRVVGWLETDIRAWIFTLVQMARDRVN